jgi:hypothetical protein
MHHKYHLKGKRSKGKQTPPTPAAPNFKKMVHSDIPQTPEFISRVANLPVVHSAIDYASDAYIKAKVKFSSNIICVYLCDLDSYMYNIIAGLQPVADQKDMCLRRRHFKLCC